ncbi:hypothetical protein LCGC14_2227180, partial [marine sediment metagenome]
GDIQNKGSDAHAYRLRISPPRPDFELRLIPSAIALHQREATSVVVHALRKDGFAGQIKLDLKDGISGLSARGKIPSGQDKARVNIRAAEDATVDYGSIQLEGTAVIDGQTIRREAVPADEMMQAFLWRHLVPAKELVVAVKPVRRYALVTNLPEGDVLTIPFDGSVELDIRRAPGSKWGKNLKLSLSDAPNGIVMDQTEIKHGKWKTTVVFRRLKMSGTADFPLFHAALR